MSGRSTSVATIAIVCAFFVTSTRPGLAQRSPDGTAAISGAVVTTGTSPTPLARVLVTISGDTLKPNRTVITDDQGRFAFRNLPTGRFTIVAARPAYVRTAFGAKRPGRQGTPIDVAARQQVTGVTIALARGAAITGTIRHANGEVAPGVKVQATPLISETQAGSIRPPVVTDDRGVYRIFELLPGRYLVTATVTDIASTVLTQFSDAEMDGILARLRQRSTGLPTSAGAPTAGAAAGSGSPRRDPTKPPATYGYAPIVYPGTADPDLAVALTLGEGEERTGVDIGLQLVRTAAIRGRVSVAGGVLSPGTQVTLTRQAQAVGSTTALTSPASTRPPDASGDFQFTGILPGKYRVMARTIATTPASVLWASADVTISGEDVSGLALMLQPGLRLSGRLVFDSHTQAPPRDLTTVRLRLSDASVSDNSVPPSGAGRGDGTFEIAGIPPGTYGVTSPSSPAGWWLRSVVIGGRDVLDDPLELGAAGDVTGAVATFTDQPTELSGSLQTATNTPAPDYFVVVFSSDRTFWRPASRRVQFTRPSSDGHFMLRNLPAGDYLIAALTDLEPSDLIDVSFMDRLVSAAVPVHLNNGEKKVQDLRLARY